MYKVVVCVVAAIVLASAAVAFVAEDIERFPECAYCGMDRAKFAHSRMLIEYDDGSAVGTCSLRCAAVDLALTLDKTPGAIRVADRDSRELIDAKEAFWVIGGSEKGVMTRRAKWAFKGKSGAEKFIGESGGAAAGFEEAIEAAYVDLYKDTEMTREKRKMKKMKKMKGM